MNNNYENIINLPYNGSKRSNKMSLYDRSAQFAPFSALTGYEDKVKETGRLTDKKIEIDEGLQSLLNSKLSIISDNIKSKPLIAITYFVKDSKKDGGKYVSKSGNVKKIDDIECTITLTDGTIINLYDVINITGEILKEDLLWYIFYFFI